MVKAEFNKLYYYVVIVTIINKPRHPLGLLYVIVRIFGRVSPVILNQEKGQGPF